MQYEISIVNERQLSCLQGYKIIVVCDDSTSMNAPVGRNGTRWSELKDTVGIVVDVGCTFDRAGIDVYFLNRPPVLSVRSGGDRRLAEAFSIPANGTTPLASCLDKLSMTQHPGKVLYLIATDGEPSEGPEAVKNLVTRLIRESRSQSRFQFLVCTDDNVAVKWLDKIDRKFAEVDVTDDFYTERAQVLKTRRVRQFTRGDWVIKALLGSVMKDIDNWDEGTFRLRRLKKKCSIM